MNKITIKDKEYEIKCNMRSLIEFQRIVGVEVTDTKSMTPEQVAMSGPTIAYCMLSAEDQEKVSIDDIMLSIDTKSKMDAFNGAVKKEIFRFFEHQPGDAKPAESKEEDGGKND